MLSLPRLGRSSVYTQPKYLHPEYTPTQLNRRAFKPPPTQLSQPHSSSLPPSTPVPNSQASPPLSVTVNHPACCNCSPRRASGTILRPPHRCKRAHRASLAWCGEDRPRTEGRVRRALDRPNGVASRISTRTICATVEQYTVGADKPAAVPRNGRRSSPRVLLQTTRPRDARPSRSPS